MTLLKKQLKSLLMVPPGQAATPSAPVGAPVAVAPAPPPAELPVPAAPSEGAIPREIPSFLRSVHEPPAAADVDDELTSVIRSPVAPAALPFAAGSAARPAVPQPSPSEPGGAGELRAALTGTVTSIVSPLRAVRLPFEGAPPEVAPPSGARSLPLDRTATGVRSLGKALPFEAPSGVPAAGVPLPGRSFAGRSPGGGDTLDDPTATLTIVQYASLCAELSATPAEAAADVFSRYGLTDPETRRTVDAAWRARLGGDPAEYKRWQQLYWHFHAQLPSPRAAPWPRR